MLRVASADYVEDSGTKAFLKRNIAADKVSPDTLIDVESVTSLPARPSSVSWICD